MDIQELLYYIYMDEQEKKAASDDEQAEEDEEKAGNWLPCFIAYRILFFTTLYHNMLYFLHHYCLISRPFYQV